MRVLCWRYLICKFTYSCTLFFVCCLFPLNRTQDDVLLVLSLGNMDKCNINTTISSGRNNDNAVTCEGSGKQAALKPFGELSLDLRQAWLESCCRASVMLAAPVLHPFEISKYTADYYQSYFPGDR